MKSGYSKIVFILDRSASMRSMKQTAIDGYNGFVTEQASLPGEADITLVLFNHRYERQLAIPLHEAVGSPLDESSYAPAGTTALLDALGRSIVDIGNELSLLPEDQRPEKVIFAVMTDGEENASHDYKDSADIAKMIQHQQDVYSWDFFFLGANMDALAQASAFGIKAGNAFTYTANNDGLTLAYANASRFVTQSRMGS